MKRMHIHISVDDLQTSIKFYSAMLGADPTVSRTDYAKWAIDNPKVNLAISQQAGNQPGIDHLGIQAETGEELDELYARLGDASYAMLTQKGAKCCYAESDKHWAVDPAGIAWEMFHTLGEVTVYGNDRARQLRDIVN